MELYTIFTLILLLKFSLTIYLYTLIDGLQTADIPTPLKVFATSNIIVDLLLCYLLYVLYKNNVLPKSNRALLYSGFIISLAISTTISGILYDPSNLVDARNTLKGLSVVLIIASVFNMGATFVTSKAFNKEVRVDADKLINGALKEFEGKPFKLNSDELYNPTPPINRMKFEDDSGMAEIERALNSDYNKFY